MQRLERWWRKRRGQGQEEQQKPKTRPVGSGGTIEIDTDTFPGIGYHIDYTSIDENGQMGAHATFSPDVTPDRMLEAFLELERSLIENPPKGMTPESYADLMQSMHREVKKARKHLKDEDDIS